MGLGAPTAGLGVSWGAALLWQQGTGDCGVSQV